MVGIDPSDGWGVGSPTGGVGWTWPVGCPGFPRSDRASRPAPAPGPGSTLSTL